MKSIKEGTLRFLGYIFLGGAIGVMGAIVGVFLGVNMFVIVTIGLIGGAFFVGGIFMISKANAIKASTNKA